MKAALIVLFCVALGVQGAAAADLAVNAQFQQGISQFAAAEYSQAFATFDRLGGDLGNDAEFHYYHGLSLTKTDQNERAIAAMQRAIELEPDNAEYRYALGLIYAARMADVGLFTAARMLGPSKESLLKAVELDPEHVGATVALVEFLLEVPGVMGGDAAAAQDLIDKLKAVDATAAAFLQAKLELRNGNRARAEELYLQAIAGPGSATAARVELAKFYLDQQEYSKVVTYAEEYLRVPKRWPDFASDTTYAHLWLALAYHALGDTANFQVHAQAMESGSVPRRVREEIENSYEAAGIE